MRVYYYLKDSARAFDYQQVAAAHEPSSDSVAQAKIAYTKDLLLLEFGEHEQGLALMDSLLRYFKDNNRRLYQNLGVSSLKNLKRLSFLENYPNFLYNISGKISGNDARLHTYLEIGLNAQRLQLPEVLDSMSILVKTRWQVLDTATISLAEKAPYYKQQSLALFNNKAYAQAYRVLANHTKLRLKADSLAGKEKLQKAEILLRIKTEQLQNEALEKKLASTNYQLIITLSVIAFLLVLSTLNFKNQRIAKKQSFAQAKIASARGQMISILSHDIKAPLSQIKGVLHPFKRSDLKIEEVNAMAPQLIEETDKNLGLLESIVGWINLSREDLQVQKERVDLEQLIKDVKNLTQQVITAKNIKFNSQLEIKSLVTDSFLLETVLRNLLNNALKCTPKRVEFTFKASVMETTPKLLYGIVVQEWTRKPWIT